MRHPFERLLSAYRDKLENSVAGREHGTLHFYRKYGEAIVRKYRGKSVFILFVIVYTPNLLGATLLLFEKIQNLFQLLASPKLVKFFF